MEVSQKRATRQDAAEMAPRMRPEDAAEVLAADGHTPYEALEWALFASGPEAWTFRLNGKIAAMWGAVPVSLLSGMAVPWLLTTDEIDKHPKTFIRCCREALIYLSRRYPTLINRVDVRYEKALRWARRMGFEVLSPECQHGYTFCTIIRKGAY